MVRLVQGFGITRHLFHTWIQQRREFSSARSHKSATKREKYLHNQGFYLFPTV